MCGESEYISMALQSVIGSPPHVWGKLAKCRREFLQCGITPHMCGESFLISLTVASSPGSPPHVWGKPFNPSMPLAARRITPTWVGNTQPFPHSRPIAGDHPHMCGESCVYFSLNPAMSGSPPHGWGIPGNFHIG